jgi:hypothetical protein
MFPEMRARMATMALLDEISRSDGDRYFHMCGRMRGKSPFQDISRDLVSNPTMSFRQELALPNKRFEQVVGLLFWPYFTLRIANERYF